jgi:hypothetical protein
MEEEDYIIAKWAQEDVETLYNLLNNNVFFIVMFMYSCCYVRNILCILLHCVVLCIVCVDV